MRPQHGQSTFDAQPIFFGDTIFFGPLDLPLKSVVAVTNIVIYFLYHELVFAVRLPSPLNSKSPSDYFNHQLGARMSKNSPKTVAVCGATVQQGGVTLDALVKLGGIKIKAITRDATSAKSQALAARDGVEVVKADFNDLESLKTAFERCDAVFAVTDFWAACGLDPEKEIQQGKNS